jgi:hypothetical protein
MTSLVLSTVDSLRRGQGLPVPGVLVGDSVVMAALALTAEVAPTPSALAAWGFLIAAVLASPSVIPPPLSPTAGTGPASSAQNAGQGATGPRGTAPHIP